MSRKIAVIGINYNSLMGMNRLLSKLRNSLHQPEVFFFQCGSSGSELYHKILQLNVDKIIILDQFAGEEDENVEINYLTINDRILIIGLDPIFFKERYLTGNVQKRFEQTIFQIRRLIINEIFLDSVAQV